MAVSRLVSLGALQHYETGEENGKQRNGVKWNKTLFFLSFFLNVHVFDFEMAGVRPQKNA